jgi:hypothetical protein
VPEPLNVLVEQDKLLVNANAVAVNACTDSLNVNAKVVPVEFVVALKYIFVSLAQVRTGGVLSGIVIEIETVEMACVPEIPF